MEILFKNFLRFLSFLPFKIQMFLGMLLGKLFFKILGKRKKVVMWNLHKCFPNLKKNEIEIIAKRNFVRLGQALFEVCNSYFKSDEDFKKMIKNLEEFRKKISAIKGKKNLILIPHTGNIDFVIRVPTLFLKLGGMQRSADNKLWDKIMTDGRNKFIDKIFLPHEGRNLLKTLNNNGSVLYAPDQDYGFKSSKFINFFNHKALTVVFPSTLVKRTKCNVFLLTVVKEDNAYRANLEEINLNGINQEEDLIQINSAIEHFAENHISEYFWVHRRFKNRPKGEQSFYPDDALRENWL